jgi:hypothetical protein
MLLTPSQISAYKLVLSTRSKLPLVGESMRAFLTEAEKRDKNWTRGAAGLICSSCGACDVQPTFTTINLARHRSAGGSRPLLSYSGYEPTIGLKAVAKILNCSAEQCRRLAEAKKIPVFRIGYRWKSTASAIVRWREEQLALICHSRPSEER